MPFKTFYLWTLNTFNQDVIINWNPLKRCILMLVLSSTLNGLWLLWKIYILFTPAVQPFVHIELLNQQIFINLAFFIIFIVLIYPCYKLQNNQIAQKILPIFCLSIFAINLCRDAYLVGLLSPATASITISVTSVGLLLFERKLIYIILIPSISALIVFMYLTIQGVFPYAPLFTFSESQIAPFTNTFWTGSMFLFMFPVFIICLLLYDLMLKQWQSRENSFKHQSQVDPLTETFNRRKINQYLTDIKDEIDNKDLTYAIILLDLDHFKYINDSYGHLKGDQVLTHVAKQLKENIRTQDIIGRYGGEEFIIIIQNTTQSESHYIAQRCREALMNLVILADNDEPIHITASFGISFLTKQISIQQALNDADLAMYQAKEQGRNTVVFAQHHL